MLTEKTILIVETEVLIALDIQRILTEHNAGKVVFARSSQEAMGQQSFWPGLGLAIVELRHLDSASVELASNLIASGVSCVMTSADLHLRNGVPELEKAPVLQKPFTEEDLLNAIRTAMEQESTAG